MPVKLYICSLPALLAATAVSVLTGCVADQPKQVNVFCWAEAHGAVLPEEKWMRPPGVVCTPIAEKAVTSTGGDGSPSPTDPEKPDVPSDPKPPTPPPPPRVTSGLPGGGVEAVGLDYTVVTGGGTDGGRVTITPTR